MLAVRRRLGAPVLLTTSFLITVFLLLSSSKVTTHLLKVTGLKSGIWGWRTSEDGQPMEGIQLVVFGDSWADDSTELGQEASSHSWTRQLCTELNCTSYLNFAKSQPASSLPLSPPTGVVTSNDIHQNSLIKSKILLSEQANFTLPDFASQIKSYTSFLKSPLSDPSSTIFVISLGFWDVYHFASLDFAPSSVLIDASIDAVFTQLDILYEHVRQNLAHTIGGNATFRVVIPKVLDPTLAPGWQTQRPLPIPPSSVAEQQKNAVYLAERWNLGIENRFGFWMRGSSAPQTEGLNETTKTNQDEKEKNVKVARDVYYYDLPSYVLDSVIERSFEVEGLSDAHGLGKGRSPFSDVYLPCVTEDVENLNQEVKDEYKEVSGRWICTKPQRFLWWDGWTLGAVASTEVGRRVGGKVRSGDSLGRAWNIVH